jgi:hypothetical protein
MVSLEKKHIVPSPMRYQQVDDLPRIRATVNVVTEKDLNRVSGRLYFEIVVDAYEKLGQQIGTPVYVSDDINAPTDGDAWPRFRHL